MRPFWRHSRNSRLSPRFRHCHYFQKVAIRILEVDASPATAGVELAVRVIVGPASVRESLRLHPAEDLGRGDLVFRGHDSVIQTNRHSSPPGHRNAEFISRALKNVPGTEAETV